VWSGPDPTSWASFVNALHVAGRLLSPLAACQPMRCSIGERLDYAVMGNKEGAD
jgi:hypothetical protein